MLDSGWMKFISNEFLEKWKSISFIIVPLNPPDWQYFSIFRPLQHAHVKKWNSTSFVMLSSDMIDSKYFSVFLCTIVALLFLNLSVEKSTKVSVMWFVLGCDIPNWTGTTGESRWDCWQTGVLESFQECELCYVSGLVGCPLDALSGGESRSCISTERCSHTHFKGNESIFRSILNYSSVLVAQEFRSERDRKLLRVYQDSNGQVHCGTIGWSWRIDSETSEWIYHERLRQEIIHELIAKLIDEVIVNKRSRIKY